MSTLFRSLLQPAIAHADEIVLPERLHGERATILAIADATASVLIATVVAVFTADPRGAAIAIIVLGVAAALSGRYRRSFAVRSRDEWYSAVALLVESAAFVALAIGVFATGWLAPTLTLILACAACGAIGTYFCKQRRAGVTAVIASTPILTRKGRLRARSLATRASIRVLDIVFAAIALVLLSPLIVAVAVILLADSGTPVIFAQRRVGRHDRAFTMYKFRTMRADAGTEWVTPGDQRITRVGAFLRKSSLDELPQLWNVIVGDMSLVGPRPEMPEYAATFERQVTNYPDRHVVRPGITGWAQLHCPRNLQPTDMPTVLAHDLFYVENVCVHLYVFSLVQTAAEVFTHAAV